MGAISALGQTVEEFWRSCLSAKSVVEAIPEKWLQYSDFNSRLWSPFPELDFDRWGIRRTEKLQADKSALLAVCAAIDAVSSAGLSYQVTDPKLNRCQIADLDRERCSVFIGTGMGGISSFSGNQLHHTFRLPASEIDSLLASDKDYLTSEGCRRIKDIREKMHFPKRLNPFVVSLCMPNGAAAAVSRKFSFHGPAKTSCAACAAGTTAIGEAFQAVRGGATEVALCGGTEFLQDEYGVFFRGFDLSGALVTECSDPESANCPFDKKHSGFLFSQGGAAMLLLEEYEHAVKRGAAVLAELIGFAESSDACSIMEIDPQGIQISRVLRQALKNAGCNAEEIDYINTHGTSTPANDNIEAGVIAEIFGRKKPLLNSTKSLLGHCLGASGAFEAVIAVLSLRDGVVHPCRALREPIADLNFALEPVEAEIKTALTQSFAFGGHNAALVLRAMPS